MQTWRQCRREGNADVEAMQTWRQCGRKGNVDAKAAEIPAEVVNTLVFMDQLCSHTSIPRCSVHAYVPPYIFDKLDVFTKRAAAKR